MNRDHDDTSGDGISRRHALECMIWAGTGVLWTLSGGVPVSLNLLGEAEAAEAVSSGFTFLQISDSHIGFDKAANPHAIDTLKEAMAKIQALTVKPSFLIHTGDITHLSKAEQFDNAAEIIGGAGYDVHYVPGEHDLIDEGAGRAYLERYGKNTKGAGWYSFDQNGVHFVGLVNVVDLKAGGLGNLGPEQLAWLADDLEAVSTSTPVVVFAHIPLWAVYPDWGWGTDDAAQALGLLKRFGSVTVLNGHIHQIMQKVEGNVTFHTARSTAFPQPAPGAAKSPGPMTVPAGELRGLLGISSVAVKQGNTELAIIACLKAHAGIGTYAGGNARAWLLTIGRNASYTWLSRNRPRNLVAVGDLADLDELSGTRELDAADGPEAALIAKADTAALEAAIAGLPHPLREVLVLRDVNSLSYREMRPCLTCRSAP